MAADTARAARAAPTRRPVAASPLPALALLVFALLLGLAAATEPTAGAIARFDATVAQWLRSLRAPSRTLPVAEISAMGAPVVVNTVVLFALAVLAVLRDWAGMTRLALAGAAAGLSSRLLKVFFERARPADLPALWHAEGFSYPSGHSVGAALLFVSLALLAGRAVPGRGQRAALLALALVAVAMVGATRVFLGVHHASDVVGGAAIGAGWALLLLGRAGDARPRRAADGGRD